MEMTVQMELNDGKCLSTLSIWLFHYRRSIAWLASVDWVHLRLVTELFTLLRKEEAAQIHTEIYTSFWRFMNKFWGICIAECWVFREKGAS